MPTCRWSNPEARPIFSTAIVLTFFTPRPKSTACCTMATKCASGAVIVGSANVNPGYKLVHNQNYPQIAEDYERMWRVLKSLPCDIFLGAHGGYFEMEEKYARLKDGAANPFLDPDGYQKFVAQKEQEFHVELAKQQLAPK